jgi:nicotinamidase-related amidase
LNSLSNSIRQDKALVLIDVQQGFHDPIWGVRNNLEAESKIKVLLTAFRQAQIPVIHVQHLSREVQSPLRPGQAGVEFMDGVGPHDGEPVFQKSVNSGFIGTNLENYLRTKGIQSLILVGFTSDHCVSTTARMGANLGFLITVVADATVAFDRQAVDVKNAKYPAELVHQVSLASLNREFATIATCLEVCRGLNSDQASIPICLTSTSISKSG